MLLSFQHSRVFLGFGGPKIENFFQNSITFHCLLNHFCAKRCPHIEVIFPNSIIKRRGSQRYRRKRSHSPWSPTEFLTKNYRFFADSHSIILGNDGAKCTWIAPYAFSYSWFWRPGFSYFQFWSLCISIVDSLGWNYFQKKTYSKKVICLKYDPK